MPCLGPLPKPGDLIEFDNIAFEHWGVYVGDGKIVHLTDPVGFIAFVKEHKLTTFVFDYKVNNKYDKKAKPYPPEKIVKAARKEVGKIRIYDLLKANCEHFATELRYGTPFCEQVEEAKIITSFGEWSRGAIGRAVNFVQKRIGLNE
ncbi:phospholipase A and acyltransferase 4-like isoform X2 [Ranitomeya imitator]|uniref:phospholipase A and acyltransferase 4-like isoform X2 n=1 Tax=Ranitomeya imitator TaxID=111125 RepID=UPI0037E71CC9